jgi:two-component system NtrC family sensor kinase
VQTPVSSLFDHMPEALIAFRREARPGGSGYVIDQVNAAAVRMLGRPREDALGIDLLDIGPDAITRPQIARYDDASRTGQAQVYDVDLRPFGDARTLEIRLTPYPDGLIATFVDVTARRDAERAHIEAEIRLQGVLDATAHAVLGARAVVDQGVVVDFEWTFVNAAAREVLGAQLDRSRLFGSERDAHRTAVFDVYTRVFHTQTSCEFRVEPPHQPGRFWDVRVAPTPDGVVVTFADVSDHVRLVAELERRRIETDRLAVVARATDHLVVLLSRDGTVEWVNDAFCRATGWSTSDLVGRRPIDVMAGPQTDPSAVRDLVRAVRDGGRQDAEVVAHDRSGQPLRLHVEMRPVNGANGDIAGFVGVATDLTASRGLEEALRREHHLVSRVLAHVPYQISWRDRDLVLQGGNAAPDARPPMFDPDLTAEQQVGVRREVIDGGRVFTLTHQVEVPGVGPRICRYTALPLDHGGGAYGVLEIREDVTEREQEATRKAHNGKLESIGQLAAGIAHEINTPTQYATDNVVFLQRAFDRLVPVVRSAREVHDDAPGARDRLRDALGAADVTYLTTEIPAALQQAREGLGRVTRIVQAMRDFSHPSHGEVTAIDLRKAVETTITVTHNEWKYSATVEVEIETGLPPLRVVADEFNQALLNLVVNAAHAIVAVPGRRGVIRITGRHEPPHVVVAVEDNGTGIAPSILKRIFDPFFTTKPVGRGTGQGLAIVHGVMTRHHGVVEVSSTVDVGSCFTLRFPV